MLTRLFDKATYWVRSKRIKQLRTYEARAKHDLITVCLGSVDATALTNQYLREVQSELARLEAEQRQTEVYYGMASK